MEVLGCGGLWTPALWETAGFSVPQGEELGRTPTTEGKRKKQLLAVNTRECAAAKRGGKRRVWAKKERRGNSGPYVSHLLGPPPLQLAQPGLGAPQQPPGQAQLLLGGGGGVGALRPQPAPDGLCRYRGLRLHGGGGGAGESERSREQGGIPVVTPPPPAPLPGTHRGGGGRLHAATGPAAAPPPSPAAMATGGPSAPPRPLTGGHAPRPPEATPRVAETTPPRPLGHAPAPTEPRWALLVAMVPSSPSGDQGRRNVPLPAIKPVVFRASLSSLALQVRCTKDLPKRFCWRQKTKKTG